MSIKIDIKEIERRANYAAFQDGLMEIFLGLFLVFFGGALMTNVTYVILLILATVFGVWPLIERLKRRYIYPRSGYVKLPSDPNTTGKGIAVVALISVVLLLGTMGVLMAVFGAQRGSNIFLTYIVPPATGLLLAIGPYWLGQTYGIRRGYLWAALFLLGGIAMPLFGIAAGYEAVGMLCTVIGLLILLTGAIMFVGFIRNNPPQTVEIEEASNA